MWAVILKETDEMIGQCGLTIQIIEDVNTIEPKQTESVLEIGYLFQEKFWHQGYATEAANACKEYAFNTLNATKVFSIIRDTNIASQNVALRIGMTIVQTFTKHYRGIDMPHYIFSVEKSKSI